MLRVTCQQEGGVVSGTAPDVVWVLVPQNGQTALHVACSFGRLEVVRFLAKECDGELCATDAVIHTHVPATDACSGSPQSLSSMRAGAELRMCCGTGREEPPAACTGWSALECGIAFDQGVWCIDGGGRFEQQG